jgi:hypothetical protein
MRLSSASKVKVALGYQCCHCQQPEVTPVAPIENKIQYYQLKTVLLDILFLITCNF